MQTVKVTGTDFVREISSMGLSNTNTKEREEYFSKRRILEAQKSEINTLKSEINTIKNDVSDIKDLLLKLMDKS